ncbi:sugar ABC transporter ATP-binding protein [Oceanobacillus alkalisoli]|uniref:sugar ABC transporter ATP-binding protein n=1 Tax=Oceanobacillus alkalisoli TaxID=2925113 RepID=UPI001EE3E6EE|nr:sugar ABC transporter ATP-binding protein [Oceanobacillus alkalisoli]
MRSERSLVEMENIHKSFGKNTVLKGVSVNLMESEVISIIGGNGAGKSTLMKILTGVHRVDDGIIKINGEKVKNLNPLKAHQKGIYLVPQEPLLFPNMTVEQNISIGFDFSKQVMKEKTKRIVEELGWEMNMSRLASSLTIAEQQQLEIIKGLLWEARILILDEPTSALTFSETKSLFNVIQKLKEKGVGIFYITHRLNEVFEISTHVVILRDGKVTLKGDIKDFTKGLLIQGLLPEGSNVENQDVVAKENIDHSEDIPILKVANICGDGFRNISFNIYKGEVVGLAGLVGAGRTEIAEAIYGLSLVHSGKIYLQGKDITKKGINGTIRSGLAYIPEDRFLHGVFPISSVKNNITAQVIKRARVFINHKFEKEVTKKYVERLRIKINDEHQEMKSLSGGNQQKAVIARILSTEPELIIMDEPTRGIDATARSDIYSIIAELKKKGYSILLISSDLEELERISDRIYGIYRGTCNAYLESNEINATNLMRAAFGTNEGSGAYAKA